jgi:hypothetical protein
MDGRLAESAVEVLAASHWSYIEGLLRAHSEPEWLVQIIGHHYKTAFIHGYKHAEENGALSSILSRAALLVRGLTINKVKKNA